MAKEDALVNIKKAIKLVLEVINEVARESANFAEVSAVEISAQ